ncbi:hypothetical protein C8F04DRAFT_1118960 [Mycena alexandri]|uniref:Protein kinase domain-containing protein n=1 Tax=Mycena alexandri TaxID=1745969 RepID=A0AAD6SI93_9AGAR|nr:hypothetical protein C8F04DRAFT_1118960 [Mycena alexandri]
MSVKERLRPPLQGVTASDASFLGDLLEGEVFWRDRQVWLQGCGYMLRPRYRPGWIPSWRGTNKFSWQCEDGEPMKNPYVIDAVRIRDSMDVCLKLLDSKIHEFEHAIVTLFSSDALANHPRNHCVPVLETLLPPNDTDMAIIVMPLLRPYSKPRFDTFGEAVDFFNQVFEGMKFMHDHNVAHRDCTGQNIMMEASRMFPDGYHPLHFSKKRDLSGKAKFYTRTQRPPKYFFIDFGISRRYESRSPPPLEDPIRGGDKSVPEFRLTEEGDAPEPCDPFPTDIYYLGNMILKEFIEGDNRRFRKMYGFEFMRSLATDMVAKDPAKRPTIDKVVERFAAIRSQLGFWKLRSRIVKAGGFPRPSRPFKHWYLRIGYILRRVPAIPSYRHSE